MTATAAEFLRGIIYNADKRERYYSLEEQKVSTSPSKRHDKRWFRIPDWANGKADSIVGLWNLATDHSCRDLLTLMGLWARACEVCDTPYAFQECKTIADSFGDNADHALGHFRMVRDLLETRVNLSWQASRAAAWAKSEVEKLVAPAAEAVAA
jgi:hypothetical protein